MNERNDIDVMIQIIDASNEELFDMYHSNEYNENWKSLILNEIQIRGLDHE